MQRRRLIVESAALCFIEKGFHQTSVRDIAGKAGISLGNLYNHFEGKAQLIAEIASLEAEELGEVEARLAEDGPPAAMIDRFVGSYFNVQSQLENAVLTAEIATEAIRNAEVAAGFMQNRERLTGLISKILARGRAAGQFNPDVPADEMADLILDLAESAATRAAFAGGKQRARIRKSAIAMIGKAILA